MQTRLMVLACAPLAILIATPQITQSLGPDDESTKEASKPAIERGVEYLKRTQSPAGTWQYLSNGDTSSPQVIGATALAAIALMECGVPANDRQIALAVNVVRQAIASRRLNFNYSICLSLLLFDRLHKGSPPNHADAGLIRSIADAIARGQSATDGGWGYNLTGGNSDNSNTQFAVVALWVARKYYPKPGGLVDQALARAEKRFRGSQRLDGGWGYDQAGMNIGNDGSTGTMTCAGLLGIALSAAAKAQKEAAFGGPGGTRETASVYRALETDEQVKRAKEYLVNALEGYVTGGRNVHITYFFWSLERTATLYHWEKKEFNGVDWFATGSRFLMKLQSRDGSWNIDPLHGPAVDTSFSLLFLAKSNLLGSLQEATFTNPGDGSLTGGIAPLKEKKPQTPLNHEQIARNWLSKLPTALAKERTEILNELRDAPLGENGVHYTNALLEAISKLDTNIAREMAREALAGRLQRMTAKPLHNYLADEDRELRLAAVRAVKFKNDLDYAGDLISLIEDKDNDVATAALDSLEFISNQKFGKSVSRWTRWLESTKPKKP